MVYDDDTYDPLHVDIDSSDRWATARPWTSVDLSRKILELARQHPSWSPSIICDVLRRTGEQVELSVVEDVLTESEQSPEQW
ncbi:hypothetical protein [Frankia canadensis]|nr:hypothetical protein [Frankia canadensis]